MTCERVFRSLSTNIQIIVPLSDELPKLLQKYSVDGKITRDSVKALLQNSEPIFSYPGCKVVRCGPNIAAKTYGVADLSNELAAL